MITPIGLVNLAPQKSCFFQCHKLHRYIAWGLVGSLSLKAHVLSPYISRLPYPTPNDLAPAAGTMADTTDGSGHRAMPQSPLANGGATVSNMNGKRPPRPKRIASISQDDDNDGDGDGEASQGDYNCSSRSLDTSSTTSTAVHCSDTQRSFAMSHRILPVDLSYGDSSNRPPRTSRRSARFARTANRLTKSLSTPILRTDSALDAICRPERRSNRERYNARGRLDFYPLLSERRSLSPANRDSAPFRIRDRPRPSRLARVGSRSFCIRNDTTDEGSRSGGEEHSFGDGKEESYDKTLANIAARFTRRATLPENIKPMQDDHQSDIMDPNAMRYLPKILRDIYAQRQRRRPSQVRRLHLLCGCELMFVIDLELFVRRPRFLGRPWIRKPLFHHA